MQTHPNFKSASPEIKDMNDLNTFMSGPLARQYLFAREMIPPLLINSFKIDLEKIDRLYYFNYVKANDGGVTEYSMIIRLDNESQPLYVDFTAFHDEDFEENMSGYIFISADVDLFMKVIADTLNHTRWYLNHKKDSLGLMYDFLQKEDGIQIEREFDKNDVKFQEARKLYISMF